MNIGFCGEFRVLIENKGEQTFDSGYQKNLITDNGLEFFGGNNGNDFMAGLVIGAGNSTPQVNQTTLDSFIAYTGALMADLWTNIFATNQTYNSATDKHVIWIEKRYKFTNLKASNISELGLVSKFQDSSNYYLTTRALIKDANGNNTTISIVETDELTIVYRFYMVYDKSDKTGRINIDDGYGNTIPYDLVYRYMLMGDWIATGIDGISKPPSISRADIVTQDLVALDGAQYNTGNTGSATSFTPRPYVSKTYQRIIDILFNENTGNRGNIRTFWAITSWSSFQVRFNNPVDNTGFVKDATKTFKIPLVFNWARYEGAL